MRDTNRVVNLSIGPTLLHIAAMYVEEEPEIRELLQSLDGVRVRVYEIDGDAGRVASRVYAMSQHLQADGWEGIGTIAIDSLTKAEELAVAHTLENVPHEKGPRVKSLEDYGFGKGLQHVFDTFLPLLADLDRHCRAGRHVVLICHDCTSTVPNPAGEDWLRYEPRLQAPKSGRASIRLRVREWADHVLFLGYDVDVNEHGKGRGAGPRTLYPSELPHCMAKSRTCAEAMAVGAGQDGKTVWERVIK